MKIAHLYPKYRGNVGDLLVQRGIVQLLRRRLGEFDYTPLSTRDAGRVADEPRGITAESVDLLNRHDLVVIGGSNLYEVAGGRWGVEVEPQALSRLTSAILLLGIGAGWSFAFPAFPELPPAIVEEVGALHARAVGSSVRDGLTQRLLTRHGIGPCTVTGCPAAFLASEPLRPVGRGVVGIPFLPRRMYASASASPRRWNNPTHRRRRLATRFFLELLERLPRLGYAVRVMVHDAADLPLAREIAGSTCFYSEDPDRLLEAIGECDVIVGFRLHAGIAALGLGIPSIPVLLDGRNAAFAETLGLLEHSVPLDPGSASLATERVGMALGPRRDSWANVFARRDELHAVMRTFLENAI